MDPHQISAILKACLDRGFVPPLYMCAVSVNGAVLATNPAMTSITLVCTEADLTR